MEEHVPAMEDSLRIGGIDEIDRLVEIGEEISLRIGRARLQTHEHTRRSLQDQAPTGHFLDRFLHPFAGPTLKIEEAPVRLHAPLDESDLGPLVPHAAHHEGREVATESGLDLGMVRADGNGDVAELESEGVGSLDSGEVCGHSGHRLVLASRSSTALAIIGAASTPLAVRRPRKPPKALTSRTTNPLSSVSTRSTPVKRSPKCSAARRASSRAAGGGSAGSYRPPAWMVVIHCSSLATRQYAPSTCPSSTATPRSRPGCLMKRCK